MPVDLSEMDLDELKSLRKDVERLIEGWEERKRREALAAAEEAARNHGFNLSELGLTAKGKDGKSRVPPVARYANPEDPTQTWSGRGRRPHWIIAALDAGKSLEDLAI